ncbi:hypothetical protein Q4I30_000723 [Leishmania utingensis]|uniref:Uncharacterized protein n=1 Tax=Leishmania utingensis TaxID=653362 RepID=A0AAW3AYN6_9TRYP
MSDLATDAGKPPRRQQRQQQASPPIPPALTETRLNANAKSFTPSAAEAPLPPSTPAAASGCAAAAAHPSAKQPPETDHAGSKTQPAGAGGKEPPAGGAQNLVPPVPQFPPAQSGKKESMMMPPPPPPRFLEIPGMVPGMPPPMPGTASARYMMPPGLMPPPPPSGMMFQPPGMPHHHNPTGMTTPPPPPPHQPGMMPVWMQSPQHTQQLQQAPGMMMPMNSMMPMPMSMGAVSSPMSPGQRSSGPHSLPSQQHQQHPGMMMPFYPPPQAPHGTMPPLPNMTPPSPAMMMPRVPVPATGPASGTIITPPAAGLMAPPPHHLPFHPHSGSVITGGAHSINNTQNHINTGMLTAANRPPSMSMPPQPPPPMMMMNHNVGSMMPPLPMPLPPSVSANARVSVGNATLAALNSNKPPKFSCVLLSGIPAVGKTTLGRELVNSLKTDGMGWAFFSGADFLTEQQGKRSVWETTRDVFDALSSRLDELLERQHQTRNIKGLVIDKNCKGIEDIYYLNALLLSKDIPFVGIVGLECADDDVLVKRMGGDDYLREKLKFHRVIHARIVSLAKSAGMYRYVDATKSKDEVIQLLRTMVLGCCAQPPTRSIGNHQYDDSRANIMVDDYREYSEVLTHLFRCVNNRGSQFPWSTDLVPFSEKEMKDKGRINAIKSRYGVRRKVNGHRYLLLYREKKLYLVPPHMRAILQMPAQAWRGRHLDSDNVGTFVLEGDLTRLTRDRQKELFLVYDAYYWSEASPPSSNKMIRMTFSERQAFLAAHMTNETKAFFAQDGVECVVVHQPTQVMSEAVNMLDSNEYPSDGLVFQPVNPIHRSDHVFVWQPPPCMAVDFRIGQLLATHQPPETDADDMATNTTAEISDIRRSTSDIASPQSVSLTTRRGNADGVGDSAIRTFTLEVYDKTEKMYVQYEDATVDVRHPDVVAGCIVTCSLMDTPQRRWAFRCIRYDVLRPIYKLDLVELLGSCLIPRTKVVSWLMKEQIVPSDIQSEGNGGAAAGSAGGIASTSSVPSGPPPSYNVAAAAAAANVTAAAGPMSIMQGLAMPPPAHGMLPPPMNNIGAPPAFHAAAAAAAAAIPIGPTTPTRFTYPSASAMLSRVAAVSARVESPPAVTTPRPLAQMSTETQLKQLASIVPSFHVVDGSKASAAGSNGTVAVPGGKSAVSRATSGVFSGDGRNCAQCHKPKQGEDLRMDRRDHRHYCYSCWAESGYGFCALCGEFKEVRRESKGRHKGSAVCAPCGKMAMAALADTASNSASPAPAATAAVVAPKRTASPSTTPAAGAAGGPAAAEAKADTASPAKTRKKAAARKKAAEAPTSTDSATPAAAEVKPTGGKEKVEEDTDTGSQAAAESTAPSPTTGKGSDAVHAAKKKRRNRKGTSAPTGASMSDSSPDGAAEAAPSQEPESEKPTESVLTQAAAELEPAPAAHSAVAAEPPTEVLVAPTASAAPPSVQNPPKADVHEEKRSGGGCRPQ